MANVIKKDKCLKCGWCCHKNFIVCNEHIHIDEETCNLLNEDNTCSIYETRETGRPVHCLTIEEMIEEDVFKFLPQSCGYKRS